MNVLKFQPNTPVQVALAFPTGKTFEGRYGPRVLFSLNQAPAGETSMYLPPVAAEQIKMLGIQPNERFEIVRSEQANGSTAKVEWLVSRLPETETVATETKREGSETLPPQSETPSLVTETRRKPVMSAPSNGHATVNGIPYWDSQTELLHSFQVATTVLVAARSYATAAGLPVQFTGEDLRQVAATIFIDRTKDKHISSMRAA